MTEEGAAFAGPTKGVVRLDQLLADATARLVASGVDEPRREARLLLAHALALTPADLLRLPPAHAVDPTPFLPLLARRSAREPLALITGARGFWTLDLKVDRSTLIPRPDTETLIDAALALRPDRTAIARVLDLGCGTGALLLAALSEYPGSFGVGIDLDEGACRLAHANAARNGLATRAAFVRAVWTTPLAPWARFDLILCNPPYIETDAIASLMPEVAEHEPRAALDGGPDGLDAYRALIPALPDLLSPAGLAIFEVGAGQADSVTALAEVSGLAVRARRHDFSGIARAVCLEQTSPANAKGVGSRVGLG